MKQFLSFSHVAKLLGLGLKEPEIRIEKMVSGDSIEECHEKLGIPSKKEPVPEATVPTSAIVGDQHFQTTVTRRDLDIPVLVEIKSFRRPDGIDRRWAGEQMDEGEVIFGNCFTLTGEYIDLSPEEVERIEREFRS